METGDYLTLLRSDGEALAEAARAAPSAPIAGCPGWDMTDLVSHVGGVHQWVSEMLRNRSTSRISRRDLPPAPSGTAALEWYLTQFGRLVDALEGIDPDETVWTFGLEQPGRASFWHRRLAQETGVHRWDAERTAGTPKPIDAMLAADGIDEYLDVFVEPALRRRPESDLSGSLHLHATDAVGPGARGEWWLALTPDSIERRHEHAKADAAIRGPVSDLLLWMWNRIPDDSDELTIFGDSTVTEHWKKLRF